MKKKFSKLSAFTLVEIIVVVLIAGIIAAFALPRFARSLESNKARRTRTNLTSLRTALELWEATARSYPASGTQDLDYLNTTLRLNIIDPNFNYTYTNAGATFTIDAQRTDNSYTLRITQASLSATNPSCQAGTCP